MLKLKIFLFFLVGSGLAFAVEEKSPAELNLRLGSINKNLYSVFFCVPKSDFNLFENKPPLLSFGSATRKDIESFLAKSSETELYIEYSFIFNKKIIDKDINIFVRFPFKSTQKDGKDITLYYDIKNILDSVKSFDMPSDSPCSHAKPITPSRVGAGKIGVIL